MKYVKLIDILAHGVIGTKINFANENLKFTQDRIYLVESEDEIVYIVKDDDGMQKKFGLNKCRFISSTEEEFHAQRGIRKVEKFNL